MSGGSRWMLVTTSAPSGSIDIARKQTVQYMEALLLRCARYLSLAGTESWRTSART